MLSFFPQGVLDEILNLIESVSGGFSFLLLPVTVQNCFYNLGKGYICDARESLTLLRTLVSATFIFAPKIDNVTIVMLHCILG